MNELDTDADLATIVTRSWDQHADHPHEVAQALQSRAAQISAGQAGADAIGLAEHVWLVHLADTAGLAGFLRALPPAVTDDATSGAMVQRARWALAMIDGHPAPAVADGLRWRGMHSLWAVWSARGRAGDAMAMLHAELPRALAHPDDAARRSLAASCNNIAAELRGGPRGNAVVDAFMLAAARASRELWASAGTWVHIERADYQLARCHAVLGEGAAALAHAQACLALVEQNADAPQADAFERFYAHEALAFAHHAAGDAASRVVQRSRMLALMDEVTDADLKGWCRKSLDELDAAVLSGTAAFTAEARR